ncbi:MAG: CopG family transcriptional regulator [Candidatus Omnitrophica bacterium]|nr:CopG family transcriptional regulator [Candidatus Omnitrophota bacterium]
MKIKRSDLDMPIGTLKRVSDFLPPPEELVFPEETVKVTIVLNKRSVDFFKNEAKKNRAKYQKMIRALIDQYATRYAN